MEQDELLRQVIEVLERLKITYMIVGSIASGAYGEPRMTQDIDVVVDLRYGDIGPLCEAFGPDEFYVSVEAAAQAFQRGGQFNVIHPASGNKIDFMMARHDSWGDEQMSRRQRVRILPDREGYTARPEDIIIGKMEYYKEGGSEKHLRDIAGIMRISGEEVDRDYVVQWAEKLGLMEVWTAVLRRLAKGQDGNSSGDD